MVVSQGSWPQDSRNWARQEEEGGSCLPVTGAGSGSR
jgi:hypothetical protein